MQWQPIKCSIVFNLRICVINSKIGWSIHYTVYSSYISVCLHTHKIYSYSVYEYMFRVYKLKIFQAAELSPLLLTAYINRGGGGFVRVSKHIFVSQNKTTAFLVKNLASYWKIPFVSILPCLIGYVIYMLWICFLSVICKFEKLPFKSRQIYLANFTIQMFKKKTLKIPQNSDCFV